MGRQIKDLLVEAYALAAQSPDPSNQNGAVVVLETETGFHKVGGGFNTFTPGIEASPEQIADREWKLFHIEHAERNAIFDVARNQATKGLILVCPWFACGDCARAIVMSGIRQVIGHKQRMDTTPDRWKASVEAGLNLLRKGGVDLMFYDGKLDCPPIKANGEVWYP